MRKFKIALFLSALSFLIFYTVIYADAGRGVSIVLKDKSGKEVGLYKESHALIIGVSGYTSGWPKLPGVLTDVKLLKEELEQQGFQVVVVKDPNRSSLLASYDDFINKYGQDADNRLLFYFAGHGHTMRLKYGGDMGYIVPADAPNPNQDERGFLSKAVSMQQIEVYAKNIQSKHAMFLFDSCFSGSIFNLTRAVPEIINEKTSKPVRQFITSGDAGEQVPDESVFRGQFIAALKGKGDLNGDGYVTGVELGEFLQDKVVNYSKGTQHPKYGKIRDPNLDEGDFVFPLRMANLGSVSTPPPPSSLPLSIPTAPAPVVLQGHLQVNVNAPSARVYVNGEDKGIASPGSPLNMENLSTGTASIRVEAEGYEALRRTVTIQRNQWTQEVFELKRIQVANLSPPPHVQKTDIPKAVIETKYGNIELKFFPDVAPNHVKNFIKLTKDGFYNGTIFHRVIPGFMIQGGDPNTKGKDKATYGMGGPSHKVKAEFNNISHKKGILSMARSTDPDSAGSQFFIVVKDSTFLDNQYTVFGEVTKGMDVTDKIVNLPRNGNDLPDERVEMKVKIVE